MKGKFNQLFDYLNSLSQLPQKEKIWLQENCKLKKIVSGQHVLRQGDPQTWFGFNCQGLFKYYYLDINGKERIKYFCEENQFVLSLTSLLDKSPSLFNIQALEDSVIIVFKEKAINQLLATNTYWKTIFQKILVQSLIAKEKREADFLMASAEERYWKFLRDHPAIAGRVKQIDIAEYLGISHIHLSRIRSHSKSN